jgi:hypothetical protein
MKRTFIASALSIAVLCGVSVAIILALISPPPTRAAADPSPLPSPPIAVAPTPVPSGPVVGSFRGGKLYRSATDLTPNAGRPGDASRRMADRVTQKAVHKALRATSVQSRLAGCTKVEGFGGTSASGPVPRTAPASLVLELEAGEGGLRVVDANVRDWGGASEAMVACARTVLRGQIIPAPRFRLSAGARMQMHFRLVPRDDAFASR